MFLSLLALGFAAQHRPAVATRFTKKIALPKNYDNGFGCDMCRKVVDYIEKLMKDATVESEIIKLAEQLCETFPAPYSSLCDSLVEQYVPLIMQWIEEGLESLDVCSKIGLCSTQAKKPVRFVKKIALPKNYNNGFGCDMCRKVVDYIEQLMKDATVESEIIKLAEQLCETFPAPYSSLCDSLVEQYVPLIMQWIEEGLESLDVCSKIGLCSTQAKKAIRAPKKLVLPPNYKNGFGCDMCTKVVEYIEQLMKDATVESEIIALVEQLCETFPAPYSSLCDSLVEQYVPLIMQWIEEGLESLDVCSKIGLCSTNSKALRYPRKLVLPQNYNNGFGCDMCRKVVDYIEKLMKDATVESEIIKLAEQLCETFPAPYSSLCDSLVEQYVPLIMQWIEEGLESLDVCSKIGLCSTQGKKTVRLPKKYVPNTPEGCETCKRWFGWALEKLEEITYEALWMLIFEECPKVPYLKYFCEVINEENLDTFYSLLKSSLPPEQCCEWVKAC